VHFAAAVQECATAILLLPAEAGCAPAAARS
jgi:hypothetical protein